MAADDAVTNEDLFAEIRDWRTELNGRVGKLEAWRVNTDAQLERQHVEIIRQVSGTLQAMVQDAIHTTMQQDFRQMYHEQREHDRVERKQDVEDVMHGMKAAVTYVLPFLQLVIAASVVYALIWR